MTAPPRNVHGDAHRVKHGTRVYFVAGGVAIGVVGTVFAHVGGTAQAGLVTLGLVSGAALGAAVRRDRCSVCRAALPLAVIDERCPSCGRGLSGSQDGELWRPQPEAPRVAEPARARVPYRTGSVAERDAGEEALADAVDVDGFKRKVRADPKIAEARAEGDHARLYRLVRARRRKAETLAEQVALDAVLADPRVQIERGKTRPWLGVWRGTGFLLGHARDHEPDDGSFIAEQMIVVGGYTVSPVASYAVRRRAEGGIEVMGRVPLPFGYRFWRFAVAMPVAAGIGIGAHAFVASRSSDVHLINALDVPVTVAADGEATTLGPGARVVRSFTKGRHHLVVRDASGRTMDETDLEAPGGDALVAYNVLGAALIEVRPILYGRDDSIRQREERRAEDRERGLRTPESHLRAKPADRETSGARVFVRDDVSYRFIDAPPRIDDPGHAVLKWQVTTIPGGWKGSVGELRTRGHLDEACELATAVSLAEPEQEAAVDAALELLAERKGDEAARAHLAKLAARAPTSKAVHAARERLERSR